MNHLEAEATFTTEIFVECRNKEQVWRLKSPGIWLMEGDQNTAYFHRIVKFRKAQNRVKEITLEGKENLFSMECFKQEAYNHFCSLLLLKLVGGLKGTPKGQLLDQGQRWRLSPVLPQLRLPTLYGLSPMGGDPIYRKSLARDESTSGCEMTLMIVFLEGGLRIELTCFLSKVQRFLG